MLDESSGEARLILERDIEMEQRVDHDALRATTSDDGQRFASSVPLPIVLKNESIFKLRN